MPSWHCWHQHTRTASWFALINPCAASLIFDPRPRSLPRAHDSLRRLSLTPARRSGVPLTSEAVAIGVARARLLALARSGKRSDRRSQQSVVIPPSSARSCHALSSKYRATYAVTARRAKISSVFFVGLQNRECRLCYTQQNCDRSHDIDRARATTGIHIRVLPVSLYSAKAK